MEKGKTFLKLNKDYPFMINIIAAIGKNRELGKDNKLLWHIPEDFKRFKKITEGQVVIMGRKTYESLDKKYRPLPNRINIVITRDVNYSSSEVEKNGSRQARTIICSSIEEAINKAKEFHKEIFIIGGAQIYSLAIKYTDKLYLTLVDKDYPEADVFFPDYSEFKMVKEEKHQDEKYSYKFVEFIK